MNHKLMCAKSSVHFLIMLLLLTASILDAAAAAVTPIMIGHWEGSARIIVDWCKQRTLPVAIDIHADGSVTGKLGDATLAHGRLTRNRGPIGRTLNLATDFIVRGDLTDPIVAAEGITRHSVSMPLDLSGSRFVGGVHTSGETFGGKESGILSAARLQLTRKP